MSIYGMAPAVAAQRRVRVRSVVDTGVANLKAAYNFLKQDAGGNLPVVLVVLSRRHGSPANQSIYADVKRVFETEEGINTVCLTERNLNRLNNPGFLANLVLKFNIKLGGINHVPEAAFNQTLHRTTNGTMIMGADVTHPGVGAVPHCPSIAAVVASINRHAATFPGYIRLQRSKQEMITDLQVMVQQCLRTWYTTNGQLPGEILFYRDGVSDSQFAMVRNHELPRIQAACSTAAGIVGSSYVPKVTLVVCSKRHHTRFFPAANALTPPNRSPWIDQTDNFKPGLVVDDPSIRTPNTFDFYLQSHAALAGTARPCHYFVIHNDTGIDMTRLQKITFGLCWIYATALTPISYAAPAYYADRLCERGRMYLLPLLKSRLIHPRITPAMMLAGLNNPQNATEDQKNDQALLNVKAGRIGGVGNAGYTWPATAQNRPNGNPHTGATLDKMFYI